MACCSLSSTFLSLFSCTGRWDTWVSFFKYFSYVNHSIHLYNICNPVAGPRVDGNRTIGREGRIKQLLDRSLQYVQTISHGAYMTISRYPTSNWQLACEAIMSNFTCNVQLARMRVTLVSLVGVRYMQNLCFI